MVSVAHPTQALRLNAENFLNETGAVRVEHPRIKGRLGVAPLDSEEPSVILRFELPEAGRYVIATHTLTDGYGSEQMRKAKSKHDSMFMDIQVNDQPETKRVVCVPWNIARQVSGKFLLEEDNEIKIRLPKGAVLDYVEITPYTPPAVPEAAASYAPKYLPPTGHPRVWVTQETLPELRGNVELGENKTHWDAVKEMALQGYEADFSKSGEVAHNARLELIAEAKAFYYLITGDEKVGREAVELVKDYISRVVFGNLLDITREIGRAIHISSEVYDWCYDLMDDAERTLIRHHLMRLADDMEIGWPPFLQSVVNGHGSEAQVNRDLLSMAIAIYDEDPVPYQYTAYLILEQLVPMRDFEYQSPRHHQGMHYGVVRLRWDFHSAWLFLRMLGHEVFGSGIKGLGDYWIYGRTPDGQMIRDGDQGLQGKPGEYHFWQMYPPSFFLNYTYSQNPYLKRSFERMKNTNVPHVLFLLLNDPAFESKELPADYPLTKDFGTVLGAMINRTGWEDDLGSDDVVAEIKGGGYFFANHQHHDAGALQVYYRGIQLGDLGLYRFYGTPYDRNFNKRSVAHSMLLVRDPAERFGGLPANDGGARYRGSSPRSLEEVLTDPNFRNGTVLSTFYGPDKIKPRFNYFSVDLASAYSDKIESCQRDYVFINMGREDVPAVILLKDQMRTKSPEVKKYWQANTLNEPQIAAGGQIILFNSREGKKGFTYIDFIYPANDLLKKEILSGKDAFNIFGYQVEPPAVNQPETTGHRVLVSPVQDSAEDNFLAILQVSPQEQAPVTPVLNRQNGLDYISIDKLLVVMPDGEQRYGEPIALNLSDTTEVFVTGIRSGQWLLEDAKGNAIESFAVAEADNALTVTLAEGNFFLKHTPQVNPATMH